VSRLRWWARRARFGRAPRRGVILLVAVAVGIAWQSVSALGLTPALRRAPYTNEVVGSSATVSWATDRSQSTGTAKWGVVSGGQCTPSNVVAASRASITVGSTSEYQWTAVLAFPSPGTYCYRVQLGNVDLLGADPSPQVKTAAAPGTSFSFAVLGDWGAGGTGEANVLRRIGASPASFVVTTGDNVYNSGTDSEYGDLTQGNVFQPQYLPAVGSRPFFAAEGNHGFSTNLPYLQNFPAPTAAQTSGGRYRQESYCCISTLSGTHTYPSSWYAFNWGSARFYVLEAAWADTQGGYQGDFLAHWSGPVAGCAPCGAELQWLKADLAAHAGAVKFAFFHYPLHSDSSSQSSDTYLTGPSGLEGLLANNGVGIVFNGHAHHYERNFPQISGKALVSYVTGGGGDALGTVSTCSAFDAYAIGSNSSCRAPKPASASNVYHFLLVTVNGSQVTVTPTDSTGRTFDVQTYMFSGSGGSGDTSAPTAPGNLTAAAASPTQVNLSWTASTDNVGVTGYTITRNGATLTTTSGTSFSDTKATPHTAYTYSVRATDAAGNLSPASNSATVTTPSGGSTFTFTPTDDAYVDQVSASTNFGAATRIVTDNSPIDDALMKFTVATGGCAIATATLSLTVGGTSTDASAKGGDLHTTVGTNWSEGTVTWANAPAANAATIASLGAVTVDTTYTLVVTSAVTGDGVASFRLTNTSSDGARYFSKEGSSTQQPRLTVTCA
jgi:chitodextrinase